jgi:hypothetical protein
MAELGNAQSAEQRRFLALVSFHARKYVVQEFQSLK